MDRSTRYSVCWYRDTIVQCLEEQVDAVKEGLLYHDTPRRIVEYSFFALERDPPLSIPDHETMETCRPSSKSRRCTRTRSSISPIGHGQDGLVSRCSVRVPSFVKRKIRRYLGISRAFGETKQNILPQLRAPKHRSRRVSGRELHRAEKQVPPKQHASGYKRSRRGLCNHQPLQNYQHESHLLCPDIGSIDVQQRLQGTYIHPSPGEHQRVGVGVQLILRYLFHRGDETTTRKNESLPARVAFFVTCTSDTTALHLRRPTFG